MVNRIWLQSTKGRCLRGIKMSAGRVNLVTTKVSSNPNDFPLLLVWDSTCSTPGSTDGNVRGILSHSNKLGTTWAFSPQTLEHWVRIQMWNPLGFQAIWLRCHERPRWCLGHGVYQLLPCDSREFRHFLYLLWPEKELTGDENPISYFYFFLNLKV